ncbi:MAG: DUF1295 domain-containing protein [Candidatus Aminicenantes bacterium]|nr:DUF1295 domain-containing protein [Candidatus Aminicenantes bacterium]
MSESLVFSILLIAFLVIGAVIFVLLFFVTAPYGRYAKTGWGRMMDTRSGWLIMESPASLLFFILYILSDRRAEAGAVMLLIVWQSHYLYRAFIYPFRQRRKKNMPLVIVLFAFVFNVINAYLQARWIFMLAPPLRYTLSWLTDIRFITGFLLFYFGMAINRWSDESLSRLRRSGMADYGIPEGRLFEWVSCPNYLGEIIEWAGWALMVWSLPGLVFALWTLANLLPRARAHHNWYNKEFPGYPVKRKALIPFVY